jgi:hypothetical protein
MCLHSHCNRIPRVAISGKYVEKLKQMKCVFLLNIVLVCEVLPPQVLSEARRDKKFLLIFLLPFRGTGKPVFRVAVFIAVGRREVSALSPYLDYPIFVNPVRL